LYREVQVLMSRKVLVVEHDVDSADLCSLLLKKHGYEVVCIFNGQEAVTMSAAMDFDFAIISSTLEGMTGIDTFQSIRRNIPLIAGILVTDQPDISVITEAVNMGFNHILKKPIATQELLKAIDDVAKTAALREEYTRMKTLLPLYELGEQFMSAKSEKDIYERLVDAVMREVNISATSVMMFDEKDELLKIVSCRGLNPNVSKKVQIKLGEKIAGRVFQLKRPIILNRQDQHLGPFMELLKRKELSAAISFPICSKDKVLGVLNVSQTKDNTEFSESDVEMLSVISRQAVMALENVWYMKELQTTSRAEALLEQYVSPEVSKILIKSKKNLMDVGTVKELTVLFADIRKFTLLVQHLPPARLREFLNNFFDLFTDIVFSCRGTLDKFMGDAALVIFGAPVEIDGPSISAVTAAGKIMTEFEKLRQDWAKHDDVFNQVDLGIGISRGNMFIGNVGSSRRLDYTVIGTDVNIVQRLASETEPGKILMTETVVRDVKEKFNIQPERPRVLRGMDSENRVYSLVWP